MIRKIESPIFEGIRFNEAEISKYFSHPLRGTLAAGVVAIITAVALTALRPNAEPHSAFKRPGMRGFTNNVPPVGIYLSLDSK